MTPWTCFSCVASYIMSQARLSQLFIDKEWTNMAAPLGAQIWNKQRKYFSGIDIHRTSMQSLLMEMFAHFQHFQAGLCHHFRCPLRWYRHWHLLWWWWRGCHLPKLVANVFHVIADGASCLNTAFAIPDILFVCIRPLKLLSQCFRHALDSRAWHPPWAPGCCQVFFVH